MSDLAGHAKITQAAVMEFVQSQASSPIAGGFKVAGLPEAVVTRDLLDVISGGHWSDFAQKHHFMRRFDGQSPYGAYEEAKGWILSNALVSAQHLAALFEPLLRRSSHRLPSRRQVAFTFQSMSWQPLGNAIHALEDSFAVGHVVRGAGGSDFAPGDIEHVKRYAGNEKEHHKEGDKAWWDEEFNGFSQCGRLAKNAVKDLLKAVFETALSDRHPGALLGWGAFSQQWLKASSKLSRQSDRAFDLIDRYTACIRIGANNFKTFDFDEQGLAQALLNEGSELVEQVFFRLDEHFNSDADDVAEIYVALVRKAGGALQARLAGNQKLVARLIKIMDEGWTSDGEQACINYLKGL